MYNKYMADPDAFSELYAPVEDGPVHEEAPKKEENFRKFDLKKLLRGLDVDKIGLVPLILLLLLLLDADDEERLIIIVLAFIFGI